MRRQTFLHLASHVAQRPWRSLAAVILATGAYVTFVRFTQGLGAVTNLSDTFPWGLWVGFDVMCGVGLAAGGFTVSAMVYLLRLERYRPLARPAVLTAFLGYLMVIGGLLYDLGHPWRLWHPLVLWNPHSVMFEVAWCVTLYTVVLAAEISAMVFERLRWIRATRIAHLLTLPLTLGAVLLSMLHQSSLGSLFLLVPGRLHELWYTPTLPILYFVSAVGAGLAMVIVEANLTARSFGRNVESTVLRDVGALAAVVLGFFVTLRILDLVRTGSLLALWPLDRAAGFFFLEIVIGFALPAILFASSRIRRNRIWLYRTALLAVFGFVINRLNVTITGFELVSGHAYVPAWTEVAVTLMLVTVGVLAFGWAARHLPVLTGDGSGPARDRSWHAEVIRQSSV